MAITYNCQCGRCIAHEPFTRVKCELCGSGLTFVMEHGVPTPMEDVDDFSVPFTFDMNTETVQQAIDNAKKKGYEYINRHILDVIYFNRDPANTHHCLCGESEGPADMTRICPHCGTRVVIPYGRT